MSGHAHADASDPFQRRAAVAIAVYTVVLAFANMLTNQARTEAILSSNRATNKWSHYQSKSTKQNMLRLEMELLAKLPRGEDSERIDKRLDGDVERYEKEKEEIFAEANELAAEEKTFEHRENMFEYAATVAELGIVLAGVALLLSSRKTLLASAAVAVMSLGLLVFTATTVRHTPGGPDPKHAEKAP